MGSKHTPTPWSAGKKLAGGSLPIYRAVDAPMMQVAKVNGSAGEMEANAALIVRAVNAHDALVDALREIEERLTLAIWSDRGSENVERAHARARAALALAEGK